MITLAGQPEARYHLSIMGSCGIGGSWAWRRPIEDAARELDKIVYNPFNANGYSPTKIRDEVAAMYNTDSIALGVFNYSKGFGSMCEVGWAYASAFLEPKDTHICIQAVNSSDISNKAFFRTRIMTSHLVDALNKYSQHPVSVTSDYKAFVRRSIGSLDADLKRQILTTTKSKRVEPPDLYLSEVVVTGSVTVARAGKLPLLTDRIAAKLKIQGITVYSPPRTNWGCKDYDKTELPHKLHAKHLIQAIDGRAHSYASLVETGFFVAIAILTGRPFGVLIEDFRDPLTGEVDHSAYPNRLRAITRAHLAYVASQTDDLIYIATDEADLVDFAARQWEATCIVPV